MFCCVLSNQKRRFYRMLGPSDPYSMRSQWVGVPCESFAYWGDVPTQLVSAASEPSTACTGMVATSVLFDSGNNPHGDRHGGPRGGGGTRTTLAPPHRSHRTGLVHQQGGLLNGLGSVTAVAPGVGCRQLAWPRGAPPHTARDWCLSGHAGQGLGERTPSSCSCVHVVGACVRCCPGRRGGRCLLASCGPRPCDGWVGPLCPLLFFRRPATRAGPPGHDPGEWARAAPP